MLCGSTGTFGVFLACRKSLEAVEDRKTERVFFFLREKSGFPHANTLQELGNAPFSMGVQMGRVLP